MKVASFMAGRAEGHAKQVDVVLDGIAVAAMTLQVPLSCTRIVEVDSCRSLGIRRGQTMTGGRLKRVREYLDDETFFFTYGDSLSDVDLSSLLAFHKSQGTLARLTAVQPPGCVGSLVLDEAQSLISRTAPASMGATTLATPCGSPRFRSVIFVPPPGVSSQV
jgi:hypothetical protein